MDYHAWHAGIGPGPDRVIGVAVPGATDAADEMVRHIRHRQPLRQSERQWLDIEVPGWSTGGAFDLKEFRPCSLVLADYGRCSGSDQRRLLALFLSRSNSNQLGSLGDQLGDAPCLVIGEGGCRRPRLHHQAGRRDAPVHAVGIDPRYPLGIGSTVQGLGKRRGGMAEGS